MALIQTVLPEPVDPAMSRWGIFVRSAISGLPGNFLAESHGNIRLGVDPIFRLQDIADEDGLGFSGWALQSRRSLYRVRGEDAHGECLEPKGDILVQRENLFHPHTGGRVDIVASNDRAGVDLAHRDLHANSSKVRTRRSAICWCISVESSSEAG